MYFLTGGGEFLYRPAFQSWNQNVWTQLADMVINEVLLLFYSTQAGIVHLYFQDT